MTWRQLKQELKNIPADKLDDPALFSLTEDDMDDSWEISKLEEPSVLDAQDTVLGNLIPKKVKDYVFVLTPNEV